MVESKSFGSRLFDVLNYALLFVLTVVFLYPLWYVLVGSISDPVRLFMHNGLLWRPLGFSLHGYRTMLQNPNVGIGYANTIFYVVVGTVLSIFFSCVHAVPPQADVQKAVYAAGGIHHVFFRRHDPQIPCRQGRWIV